MISGPPLRATCALARPDVFHRLALMSAPFTGPPALPIGTRVRPDPIHAALAALPRPRKHYQRYYSTRQAAAEMDAPRRRAWPRSCGAYYHHKSADWPGNTPFELAGWTADELARHAHLLHHGRGREHAADRRGITCPPGASAWLTDTELAVYAAEFERTGFGGGLHWYRCRTESVNADLALFAGRSDRRAIRVHRRVPAIGGSSRCRAPWPEDAAPGRHADDGCASDQARWPLGATGATGRAWWTCCCDHVRA